MSELHDEEIEDIDFEPDNAEPSGFRVRSVIAQPTSPQIRT